jgi:hypothetical protein
MTPTERSEFTHEINLKRRKITKTIEKQRNKRFTQVISGVVVLNIIVAILVYNLI